MRRHQDAARRWQPDRRLPSDGRADDTRHTRGTYATVTRKKKAPLNGERTLIQQAQRSAKAVERALDHSVANGGMWKATSDGIASHFLGLADRDPPSWNERVHRVAIDATRHHIVSTRVALPKARSAPLLSIAPSEGVSDGLRSSVRAAPRDVRQRRPPSPGLARRVTSGWPRRPKAGAKLPRRPAQWSPAR